MITAFGLLLSLSLPNTELRYDGSVWSRLLPGLCASLSCKSRRINELERVAWAFSFEAERECGDDEDGGRWEAVVLVGKNSGGRRF